MVVVFNLGMARLIASTVGTGMAQGLSSFTIPDGQNLLYALLEQFISHPGLMATWRFLLAFSMLLSLILWTVLAGGIHYRLRQAASLERTAVHTVRNLPAMFAVTLWHLIPRVVILGIAGALTGALMKHTAVGWPAALLTLLLLFYCTCALDLARSSIVLGGASPFSWRTAWSGFVQAARQPMVLGTSILFSFGQWFTVIALIALAISGFAGGYGPWPARLLSVVGIVLSLARTAVAVDASPSRAPS
jgi:hypothetical protein